MSIINFVFRCYQDMLDICICLYRMQRHNGDPLNRVTLQRCFLYWQNFYFRGCSKLSVWRGMEPCHCRAGQDHGCEGHWARRYRVHLEDFGCGGWKSCLDFHPGSSGRCIRKKKKRRVPPTYPSWFITVCCLVFLVMWVKQCHVYHPWLGMVTIPPIKNGD